MATYTTNYQLHQWAADDDFLRTDFNQDFAKIDAALAGMPKIVTGSYTGTGTYGSGEQSSCKIQFTGTPKFIIVGGASAYLLFLMPGLTTGMGISALPTPVNTVAVSWQEGGVQWWTNAGAAQQLNQTGHAYSYLIFY